MQATRLIGILYVTFSMACPEFAVSPPTSDK